MLSRILFPIVCRLSKAREQFWETCLGRVGDQLQPILGEACPGEDSYHRFFGEVFPQGEGAHIVLCMHVVVPPRVDGSSGEHLFGNVICRVSPWGFRGGEWLPRILFLIACRLSKAQEQFWEIFLGGVEDQVSPI